MYRALAPVLLAALVLTGCGGGGVPHRAWTTSVCQTLAPWRDRITALNGQAQTRASLMSLLDGARQATEDARAKVAAAGVPDVADGPTIAQRFVAALAAARDAYAKAQHGIQALPDRNETAFYAGVKTTMDALNQDYARAGVDTGRLASADLRKDFDEVPACA